HHVPVRRGTQMARTKATADAASPKPNEMSKASGSGEPSSPANSASTPPTTAAADDVPIARKSVLAPLDDPISLGGTLPRMIIGTEERLSAIPPPTRTFVTRMCHTWLWLKRTKM